MATVAATQELKPGNFLLRFKAKAFQDDIRGMGFMKPLFGNFGFYLYGVIRWFTGSRVLFFFSRSICCTRQERMFAGAEIKM